MIAQSTPSTATRLEQPQTRAEPSTWREAFSLALLVYLPVRLLLSLSGAYFRLNSFGLPADQGLAAWLHWLFVEPWLSFDVDWYLPIARDGYGIPDGRAAFHPLLPLLMRVVGMPLGGRYDLAGIIVSNLACIVFLAVLYRFVALDHGKALARESMRWALFCPLGFVLLIPYTESLLLCWTVLAFWYARHDRWLLAGLCGAAAALTKQPGAVLALPLLLEYLSRHRDRVVSWRTVAVLACLGLIPLGYLSFSLYRVLALGDLVTSDPRGFAASILLSNQLGQSWGTRFGWPWEWALGIVAYVPQADWLFWLHLALVGGGLLTMTLALRRERAALVVYSVAQVLMGLTLIVLPMPLLGLPRRIMLAFPIFTQLARWSLPSPLRRFWLALSLMTMLALGGLFAAEGLIP